MSIKHNSKIEIEAATFQRILSHLEREPRCTKYRFDEPSKFL